MSCGSRAIILSEEKKQAEEHSRYWTGTPTNICVHAPLREIVVREPHRDRSFANGAITKNDDFVRCTGSNKIHPRRRSS